MDIKIPIVNMGAFAQRFGSDKVIAAALDAAFASVKKQITSGDMSGASAKLRLMADIIDKQAAKETKTDQVQVITKE